MNDIETLLAVEAIKQTKARYFLGVDNRDWNLFGSAFTVDALMIVPEQPGMPRAEIRGVANVIAAVRAPMEKVTTIHYGHNPLIEFTADTSARVIWAMEDHCWRKPEFPDFLPCEYLHGCGHYYENYRLVDGKWLIAEVELRRLRMTMH